MDLPSAFGIELSEFIDLIRLITSSSPDRPSTILKWQLDSKSYYYGSFAIFPGYFNYKALPVLFYVTSDSSLENKDQSLVRYDLQKKGNQLTFHNHLREEDLENTHTGLVRFIPIVNLKSPPKIFTDLS